MTESAKRSRSRWVVAIVLIVALGCLAVVGTVAVRRARHAARILSAFGRLCQMHYALCNYEQVHRTLPPVCLRDKQGKPIHSWRALVFPFFDFVETESLKQLDLSQPWDSASNREVADKVPQRDWNEFARDVIPPEQHPVTTHILALLGKDSIWDAKSGLPKGTRKEFPDAILLISVPESNIEPLEPRDIPEAEVCALVKDGKEVLFIRADDRYRCGVVKVEDGRLVFRDWKEPDD